jgi:hypothetical protein
MEQEQATLVQWLRDQHERGIFYVEPVGISWSMWALYREGRVLFGELRLGADDNDSERTMMYNELQRCGNEVRIWRSAEQGIRDCKNWLWEYSRLWLRELQDDELDNS